MGRLARAVGGDGRAPQSAKSLYGVFFFIAFYFAPAYAKEKAGWRRYFLFWLLTTLGFYLVGVGAVDDPLLSRGEHCSPAKRTLREKYHKETFLLSYFSVTKSTKSHLRGLSSLLKNSFRVHELVVRAMRGKCVRQMAKLKSTMSYFPQPHTTTRANISHEEAEQIRAHIVCTPAEKGGQAWGSLCADGI